MNFKIIADSSADLISLPCDIPFESVPLKINTAQREYVDDASLDASAMLSDLKKYKGKSWSSCPNPTDYLTAFGDAENIICITITSGLSGSYNSAINAKNEYKSLHNDRNVLVIDSLSAGPECTLIVEKAAELVEQKKSFSEIESELSEYNRHTGLIFALESLHNLAANGRVSALAAKISKLLGIRVVGKASDKGDLEPLNKCRGEVKALNTIVEHLKELGLKNGKVKIAHCFNENAAKELKALIESKFSKVRVEFYKCRGLCSFYAEKGGMRVGFEKI